MAQELRLTKVKGKTVIVTGGSGFIGSHLVEELIRRGAYVTVIDNEFQGKEENLLLTKICQYIKYDIRKSGLGNLFALSQPIDYVFHLAAVASVPRSVENPKLTFDNNVMGTLNVLTTCKDHKVGRVVFSSSSSVYGDNPDLPKVEENIGKTLSPYALSKYVCEELLRQFYELYGLETVSLRYFNVFGPRQNPEGNYAAVIPKFIKLMLDNNQPQVYGDGDQVRDFNYVKNVVDGTILFADLPKQKVCGKVFNIASGRSISVNLLIMRLNEILGTKLKAKYLPERKGDIRHSLADISKAKSLGFKPSVTFEEGLKRTVQYYKEVGKGV